MRAHLYIMEKNAWNHQPVFINPGPLWTGNLLATTWKIAAIAVAGDLKHPNPVRGKSIAIYKPIWLKHDH